MAIYRPELLLTAADREALALLGQLALASEMDNGGNVSDEAVTLSPSEAARLLELLEQFAESKLFVEGSYFVEGIGNGEADTNDRLKNIYIAWRSRRGFTNVMSNQRWREFILRAGFNSSASAWMWPHSPQGSPIRPMEISHFLSMETKLARSAGLHPRVQRLIIAFVQEALPSVQKLREQDIVIKRGSIGGLVKSFIHDLTDHTRGREKKSMTRRRVVALSTIVMDTSVLFATRDWTAAGLFSSLAAVVPDALGDDTNEV